MSREKFFVWTETGNIPSFEHGSFSEARREAERLAAKNPGKEFYILKAVAVAKKVDVEFTILDRQFSYDNDIPF